MAGYLFFKNAFMKVRIRRIDRTLPLPAYKTAGAVALDLCCREDVTIEPKGTGFLPLNVAIDHPEGHFVLLAPRSSTPKRGIMFANSIGIVDKDFSGNNDEYRAFVFNYTDSPVTIARGERIAQAVFLSYHRVEWEEVDDLGNKDRGGFGTTGIA